MKDINWYYPKSINEALKIYKKEGSQLLSGGTGILKAGLSKVNALIDLTNLKLKYIKANGKNVEIGAMSNYADIVNFFHKKNKENLLYKSLSVAVPPSLRNRITLGGSISFAPIWSDLLGPLIALNAKVELVGSSKKLVPIETYLKDIKLKKGYIIKSVKFTEPLYKTYYYRASRTKFDYSTFNISLMSNVASNKIKDLSIVVYGCREKFRRLNELEKEFLNKNIKELTIEDFLKKIEIEFSDKKLGSSSYIKELFKVELERGLKSILEN